MITRVPVVGMDGNPLMPTTPRKVRLLIRGGLAEPRRNKLGLFYIRMLRPVGTATQPVALAVDPGAKYDGVAVASRKQVELKAMVLLPDDVPRKMEARRHLRRARRYRKTPRRPARFDNRRRKGYWLAPTQRSKVETRLKVVRELCKIFPIRLIVTEDVRYNHYRYRDGKHFSTVEIGKTLTYREYQNLAALKLVEVSETDAWREKFGLQKQVSRKWEQIPETHANDATAMLMGVTGCKNKPGAPFFVWRRLRYIRRSLHRQNFQEGGVRPRFGNTTNGGFFRKGDWVEAEKAGVKYRGWVCGLPTETT
ncbi:MAG TPA: RRXRR domain-containing protein, partial [Bacillota bacterium]|nr:RRXRR domain-containing protein [Bacillota bacterium]